MNYLFTNHVWMGLLLSTHLWQSEALFENVGKCNDGILKTMKSAWDGGTAPSSVLKEYKDLQPWSILHASKDLFPSNLKCVVMDNNKVKVILDTGNSLHSSIKWSENKGVLKDKDLTWVVLVMKTNVFGFYVCSTAGTSSLLTGGIALAMGPPGGIPDETKEAAEDTKEMMENLGIDLQVELDLCTE